MSPTTSSSDTQQSVKDSSAVSDDRHPSLGSERLTSNPSVPRATAKMDKPRDALTSGLVRAATNTRSALTPLVMKIFDPLRRQPAPSRRAELLIPATSEPASGSVMAMAASVSPVSIPGNHRSCWERVAALSG
jgi:hypothetical protein